MRETGSEQRKSGEREETESVRERKRKREREREEEQGEDQENGVRGLEMEITKLRLSNSLSSERNDDAYGFSRERTPLKLALLEQLVDDDGGLDDSRSMRKPKKTNVAATKPCSTTTDVYTREYSIRGTRKNEREREREIRSAKLAML